MRLYLSTLVLVPAALAAPPAPQIIPVTPHEQYSSSIGGLGCKLNTNRVAYWPGAVDCNNICVQVSNAGRSLYLLKIDHSGGAYDISYDAWNYLGFGKLATDSPRQGGRIQMMYKFVDADNCKSLLQNGKLSLSASNSINFLASCLKSPNSWVARNYQLVNVLDPLCKYGYDEPCTLDLKKSNQPTCKHQLGVNNPTGIQVKNIQYGTGKQVVAS
ncbi:hypothetical protein NQ176_g5258 [Zarea fungicola]|uniref:Uncharacterized protein n=1 Tax=Zarea fungicola TaxID=93591 RepID=A0ACC1NBS4_9HYPO|nr:hypothetical protein NQ176_g5258 [Lecanicillium fungicola]